MTLNVATLFNDNTFLIGVISGVFATFLIYLLKSLIMLAIRFLGKRSYFNVITKSNILHVYDNKNQAINRMYEDAKKSKKIYAFTAWGKTFTGRKNSENPNNPNELYPLLQNLKCDMRFLILNPRSGEAKERANELSQKEASNFVKEIYISIKEFKNHRHIKLRLHAEQTRFRVYIFDEAMYLFFGLRGDNAAKGQIWRVGNDSVLYEGFSQQFEDLWKKYKPSKRSILEKWKLK